MDEGVDPKQMCRRLFDKVARCEQLADEAGPDILMLFEDWLEELEEEVLRIVKATGRAEPESLSEDTGLSRAGVLFILTKLGKEGKLERQGSARMSPSGPRAFVEIVAKKKGCMLCDLAIGILEEIQPEFEDGSLAWEVVDVGSREGVARHAELGRICGRMPAVPSLVINGRIAFDNIPDMDALTEAVRAAVSRA